MTLYQRLEPKHIEERLVKAGGTCDLCGAKMSSGNLWAGRGGWDASRVTIEAEIGASYPECDTRDGYRLDVCPECFLDKIQPTIEREFGVKFHEFRSEEREDYYEVLPTQKPEVL